MGQNKKSEKLKIDRLLERESTPLLIERVDGKVIKLKLDYIKALSDYSVIESLPEMSRVDMMKMVNFFANNDVVKGNRPGHLNIADVKSVVLGTMDIHFDVILSEEFKNEEASTDFTVDFSFYFDSWMRRFIIVYGKYLLASNTGKLDELLDGGNNLMNNQ